MFKKQANCNCVTDSARSVDKMLKKRSFKNGIVRQKVQFFGKNTGMILAWIVVYVLSDSRLSRFFWSVSLPPRVAHQLLGATCEPETPLKCTVVAGMPEATESKRGKNREMQRLMALDVLIQNPASRTSLARSPCRLMEGRRECLSIASKTQEILSS